jgi:hypothetical protein
VVVDVANSTHDSNAIKNAIEQVQVPAVREENVVYVKDTASAL